MRKKKAQQELTSSFLSCEKDLELIIKELFYNNRPYSDYLKRLLLINTKDCLDDMTNPAYIEKIANTTIADLKKENYIITQPRITLAEHEEVKSYIFISFDNFMNAASNSHYKNCEIHIDVLCHIDTWDLGDYRLRPIKIAGYIDAILNNAKLTGIGTLQLLRVKEYVVNEHLAGYCLTYLATHGVDDSIPAEDDVIE